MQGLPQLTTSVFIKCEEEGRHHSDSLRRENDQSTGHGFERHDEGVAD